MSEILRKLSAIQAELKVPKGQYNSFGKYNYRSCEDIMEALKPVCAKYGTVVLVSDELKNIGERYYIEATAKIYDIETGDSLQNTAYAREEENKKGMDGSQITGTSSSYARKYALNGLFSIDDTKDSDTGIHKEQDGITGKTRELYADLRGKLGQEKLDEAIGMNINAVTKIMKSGDESKITELHDILVDVEV